MKNGNVKIIGLTGGIGSGKSTVSAYFSGRGYPVIDADKIAREVVLPGSRVLDGLVSVFGPGILNPDGTLDRKRLAGIAFGNRELKEKMDAIMHGEILRIIGERVRGFTDGGYSGLILLDIPLLFEMKAKLPVAIDAIWVVDADEEVRIRRIIERDGVSREDVMNRINNQMSASKKREMADAVIENSGSEEELYQKLGELIKKYEC